MTGRRCASRSRRPGFERGRRRLRAGPAVATRPRRSTSLVDELGLGPGRRVLDLAAGTGKLTRLLRALGRRRRGRRAGGRHARAAPAARARASRRSTAPPRPSRSPTPRSTRSSCAQAFHWFDAPGGPGRDRAGCCDPAARLALVWNEPRRVGRLGAPSWPRSSSPTGTPDRPYHGTPTGAGRRSRPPTAGSRRSQHWSLPATPRRSTSSCLVERAASTSFVAAAGPDERGACLDEVRAPGAHPPRLAGRDTFPLPYDTDVWWCRGPDRRSTGRRLRLLAWSEATRARPARGAAPATRGRSWSAS